MLRFFRSLAHIEPGLRARAEQVSRQLRADSTSFVVVTSPRAEAIGEAEHLIEALVMRDFPLGGVIANLVHPLPESLDSLAADELAALESLDDGPLADHVTWHRQLTALAESERDELAELRAVAGDAPLVELPLLETDVHDVDGLALLAALLTSTDATP